MGKVKTLGEQDVLISIVVPVYNCQEYIYECVQSVLNQTFPSFELILLDDGSKDNSQRICEKLSKIDNRIIVEKHQNIGASQTRKLGLELSRGKYITFLDADDTLKKDYLEKMYETIKECKSEVVCCNSVDSGIKNNAIEKDLIIYDKKYFLQAFFENKRYVYCIWGKLYQKDIFENIIFPDMKYAEDTYVAMQVFQKASSVKLINYYGYNYRDNLNGAMRSSQGIRQAEDVCKMYEYIYICCKNNYTQGIENLQYRMVQNFLIMLINEKKCNEEEKSKVKVILKKYKDIIPKKIYFKSIKGIIVYFYQKFPNVISNLLFVYKKIKMLKYN